METGLSAAQGLLIPGTKLTTGQILLKFLMAETQVARLVFSLPQRFSFASSSASDFRWDFRSHRGQNIRNQNGQRVSIDV